MGQRGHSYFDATFQMYLTKLHKGCIKVLKFNIFFFSFVIGSLENAVENSDLFLTDIR